MSGSPRFAHYALSNIVSVFGSILLDGFGPDDSVTVAFDTDAFSKTVGADGLVVRNKMHDRSGTITVTLSYGSATNGQLSALYIADQAASNGAGVAPFSLRDINSGITFNAPYCWISDTPDLAFSAESGTFVWTLQFSDGVMDLGSPLLA